MKRIARERLLTEIETAVNTAARMRIEKEFPPEDGGNSFPGIPEIALRSWRVHRDRLISCHALCALIATDRALMDQFAAQWLKRWEQDLPTLLLVADDAPPLVITDHVNFAAFDGTCLCARADTVQGLFRILAETYPTRYVLDKDGSKVLPRILLNALERQQDYDVIVEDLNTKERTLVPCKANDFASCAKSVNNWISTHSRLSGFFVQLVYIGKTIS